MNPSTAPQEPVRRAPLFAQLRMRLLALVLMALLPALGLVFFNAIRQRQTALKDAQLEAVRLARLAATSQKQHLEAARQLLLTLSQLREVRTAQWSNCAPLFVSLLAQHRAYANIGVIAPDGYALASGLPLTNRVYLGDRSYFLRALDSTKFALGDYQVGRISGKPSVSLAYPVRAMSGEFIAVLFVDLDLTWLNQLVARADLPENSTLALLDRHGTVLLRYPDPARQYTGLALTNNRAIRQILKKNIESTGQAAGLDGVERLYGYTPLSRNEGLAESWVVIGIPVRSVMAEANLTLVQNLFFLGVVALFALAAAWFGGHFFVLKQIKGLVAATEKIGEGKLHARTGVDYAQGEIGALARSFDEMADALELRLTERQRAEAQLKALNEELEGRVTDRTVELRRSNEELEQFAYVASHDLQEPLRMVTSYMQLLEKKARDRLDEEDREFIGFAVGGAERMRALITDLLAFSRVGTQGRPFEPTDCEEVLARVKINLYVALEESGASVTHDPLPVVPGDSVQLGQLLQNLIGNAIKFRGAQPPEVHVGARRTDGEWEFTVRDRGIGIPTKDFDRIFIIFQRLHTRDKYPGTGIGLSICKKIVERHGGRIWVESEEGRGRVFHFTLPALVEEGSKLPVPNAP